MVDFIYNLVCHEEGVPQKVADLLASGKFEKLLASLCVNGGEGCDGINGPGRHGVIMILTGIHIVTKL